MTSRTPTNNFHYTIMPFRLKNSRATYQRAMTGIFHDVLHDCLEDDVDDIVVKSKKVYNMKKVFERCKQYKLIMNNLKCFGVSSEKCLGFTIHRKWVNLDTVIAKAVQAMKPLTTYKQLKSFMERVSYVQIFIRALTELLEQFHKLLK